MSRGLGVLQRDLLEVLESIAHGELAKQRPDLGGKLSTAELTQIIFRPEDRGANRERQVRRALESLHRRGLVSKEIDSPAKGGYFSLRAFWSVNHG